MFYYHLFIYLIVILFFNDANGWIYNADNGDVVMQGPIAIEPSYGQDATIQLRRNSTSLWTVGSGQNPTKDNASYVSNMNMSSIMSISQQGKFVFVPPIEHTKTSNFNESIKSGELSK